MHDTSSGQYILNTLVAGKDTVPMVFDTGNSRTGLSPNYYTLHREEIDRSGEKSGETAAGGFGGILRGTGYDLKNITFTIGNGSRTLKKVTVTADFGPASEQPYFGSLGMDLFEIRPHRLRLRPDVRYGGINPTLFRPAPCTTELPVPS